MFPQLQTLVPPPILLTLSLLISYMYDIATLAACADIVHVRYFTLCFVLMQHNIIINLTLAQHIPLESLEIAVTVGAIYFY